MLTLETISNKYIQAIEPICFLYITKSYLCQITLDGFEKLFYQL